MVEILKQLGTGLACALVFVGGVVWQVFIWIKCKKDEDTASFFFGGPIVAGVAVVILTSVGALGYGILGWIDSRVDVDAGRLFGVVFSVLLVCIAFSLKSYVGAVLVTASATWTLWNLLIHGNWTLIPIFQWVFHLIASQLPDWVEVAYIIATLGYGAVSAIRVSAADS